MAIPYELITVYDVKRDKAIFLAHSPKDCPTSFRSAVRAKLLPHIRHDELFCTFDPSEIKTAVEIVLAGDKAGDIGARYPAYDRVNDLINIIEYNWRTDIKHVLPRSPIDMRPRVNPPELEKWENARAANRLPLGYKYVPYSADSIYFTGPTDIMLPNPDWDFKPAADWGLKMLAMLAVLSEATKTQLGVVQAELIKAVLKRRATKYAAKTGECLVMDVWVVLDKVVGGMTKWGRIVESSDEESEEAVEQKRDMRWQRVEEILRMRIKEKAKLDEEQSTAQSVGHKDTKMVSSSSDEPTIVARSRKQVRLPAVWTKQKGKATSNKGHGITWMRSPSPDDLSVNLKARQKAKDAAPQQKDITAHSQTQEKRPNNISNDIPNTNFLAAFKPKPGAVRFGRKTTIANAIAKGKSRDTATPETFDEWSTEDEAIPESNAKSNSVEPMQGKGVSSAEAKSQNKRQPTLRHTVSDSSSDNEPLAGINIRARALKISNDRPVSKQLQLSRPKMNAGSGHGNESSAEDTFGDVDMGGMTGSEAQDDGEQANEEEDSDGSEYDPSE